MKGVLAMLLATACLAACDGSSMTAPAAPPAQPSGMNFTAFTKQLLGIQSDSAQPSPVTTADAVKSAAAPAPATLAKARLIGL